MIIISFFLESVALVNIYSMLQFIKSIHCKLYVSKNAKCLFSLEEKKNFGRNLKKCFSDRKSPRTQRD